MGLWCKKWTEIFCAFSSFFGVEWLEQSLAPRGESAACILMPTASGLGREKKANLYYLQ